MFDSVYIVKNNKSYKVIHAIELEKTIENFNTSSEKKKYIDEYFKNSKSYSSLEQAKKEAELLIKKLSKENYIYNENVIEINI